MTHCGGVGFVLGKPILDRRAMKKISAAVAVLMVILGTAGCTPGGGPSSDPPWTATPIVWPTKPMTDEEKSAADTALKYLEVWTDISQNVADTDLNRIRDVAKDPLVNDDYLAWIRWRDNGWHLVGAPTFEVDTVSRGRMNGEGTIYHVEGCLDISGSYLVDADGNQRPTRQTARATGRYDVLNTLDGGFFVIADVQEEKPC